MERIKTILKDYFTFSRRDRTGVITLVVLIGIIYALPLLFPANEPFPAREISMVNLMMDSVEKSQVDAASPDKARGEKFSFSPGDPYVPPEEGTLFLFDPNTLPPAGWQKLGLSAKTAATIEKYRNKGGRFRTADDLKKIWGLPEGFYEQVQAYISIKPEEEKTFSRKEEEHQSLKTMQRVKAVHINVCDSAELEALPGIGRRLASRIIVFRDKLGGFYAVHQIAETYGLPDSTFQKIKAFLILDGAVKKLNVNRATKDELKQHPYIRWNLANAIVEYRTQHGAFKTLDELKNISLIDEAAFTKMLPYLEH